LQRLDQLDLRNGRQQLLREEDLEPRRDQAAIVGPFGVLKLGGSDKHAGHGVVLTR
jgi:hypothetical protein